MARASSYGTGLYAAAESSVLITKCSYRLDSTAMGVLSFPSHGNTASQALANPYTNLVLEALAEQGYPVLSVDAGGGVAWGNDTAIARVTDAKTYLQGTCGAKSGKVLVYAFSMGALTALNWARSNLSSVAAMAFACPGVDLADLHDNRGFGTEINTAYGGSAAYTAALPTHNPVQFASSLTVPCKVWSASDDATVVPSTVTAFKNAYGGSIAQVDLGAVGHTPVTVPPQDVVSFLTQYA